MTLSRTIVFWLGAFALLVLAFAWSDSIRHGRRWSRSIDGKSQIRIMNEGGELIFFAQQLGGELTQETKPFSTTGRLGEVRTKPRKDGFRFGEFIVEKRVSDGDIFVPPLDYRSDTIYIAIPHWLMMVILFPLWLVVSAWRASVFDRRHQMRFLLTSSR